jgi:hypothetical protein
LRDSAILTEEELLEKKKQLLGICAAEKFLAREREARIRKKE